MELRNSSIFAIALSLTMLLHLVAISPISNWINRKILPEFSDQSIEINLMRSREEPIQDRQIPSLNLQKPEPLTPEKDNTPLFPESTKAPNSLHPQEKKSLDSSLTDDQILSQAKSSRQLPPKPKHSKKPQQPAQKLDKEEKEKPSSEISPLFVKPIDPPSTLLNPESTEPEYPETIQDTIREGKPETTQKENLQYSMNTYKWTFKRYVENWAVDLQKWWKAPLDYAFGKVPDGGDVWIQVAINRSGKMLGYKILDSKVTAEMELMVIQALVGSLERAPMPDSFPADALIINWRFIYPPMRPELNLRR